MSYFTKEQIKWLENAGFEWKDAFHGFFLRHIQPYTTLFIETCGDEFLVEIACATRYTIQETDADLKKAIRNVCREHKKWVTEMRKNDEILDTIFAKTAGLKFNKRENGGEE